MRVCGRPLEASRAPEILLAMRFLLLELYRNGALLPEPRDWIDGDLSLRQVKTASGVTEQVLVFTLFTMASGDKAQTMKLFDPRLVLMGTESMTYRGFQRQRGATVIQEWLVKALT